ncbi:hypothetical protein HJG53_06810 [Sphingomonas sp. ID1715]|uniref:hypothetical protein n=1 Tax=Sphingomonas sp. ID1715 TaxID=1656898 RepID=UPI001487DEC6|nr:hypothetical protein [Sphingomonas sp. ID1715]NNM76608.1 hypothetical protein [Sphingomonas sp. ID1715]
MKAVAAALACTILTGCIGQPFTPTMEADPTLVGAEGIALINKLGEAYTRDDTIPFCAYTQPSFQERSVYPYRRYRDPKNLEEKRVGQFICHKFKDNPGEAAINEHLQAGYALSNLYCDTFFRRITLRSKTRSFGRDTANDVGAAVSAALALAKAGTGVTGGIGAGFGLLDATIRNYDASFLVATDLPALQKAVKTKQTEYRDSIESGKVKSYADATSIINNYAYYCSFNGMRGLVNQKLEQGVTPDEVRAYVKKFISDMKDFRAELTNTTQNATTNTVNETAVLPPM